ncbi:MAG: LPS assembly protein LptD [Desulfobacterales bacterium]|nr:LPS assembly protein LptD [Desulfobacterales bacterium]
MAFSPVQAQQQHPAYINLEGDHTSYDDVSGVNIARGNVILTYGDTTLYADEIRYNTKNNQAEAKGNVRLLGRSQEVEAESISYDMGAKTGTITKGTLFIKSNNLWIRGETLKKTGEARYQAERVSITTCDGDDPDWKITGRNLDVTIEGYGTAKHVVLTTGGIPVGYTPFLLFPVKIKRQTGLLAPSIGESTRKGFEINQPLFLALGESMDATLYAHHMSKRGFKIGGEFRYVASKTSKGIFMAEGFTDSKIDDGTPDTQTWAYSSTGTRTNTHRYWIRGKADQQLGAGIKAQLDIDWVSDQDYLQEFADGPSGFDETQEAFTLFSGRTIEEETDTVRKNSFSFTKTSGRLTTSLSAIWNDNVLARSQDSSDTTLQSLPTFLFSQSRSALPLGRLQWSMEGGAASFYRKDLTSNLYDGERAYIRPKLYMPFRAGIFSVDPSAGAKALGWNINTQDPLDDRRGTQSAVVPEFNTDISTEFYRIFNWGGQSVDKIRHRIKPTFTYAFQERLNPTFYPTFDTIDEFKGKNSITLVLDQALTTRTPFGARATYRDIVTTKFSQSWDMREDRETDSARFRNGLTQEPFTPFYAEIKIKPLDALTFSFDGTWSWYESEILTRNSALAFTPTTKTQFTLSNRFKRDPLESIHKSLGIPPAATYDSSESLELGIELELSYGVDLSMSYERDIEAESDIKKMAGLTYTASCWSLFVKYEITDDDKRVTLGVDLTGLGGFDSSYTPR